MPELNCAMVYSGEGTRGPVHHTRIGSSLKLRYLQPERAAQCGSSGFQTVRAIAAVAKSRQADFVLVAAMSWMTTASAVTICNKPGDALRSFGELPVGLLPGNHDAATADIGAPAPEAATYRTSPR